MRSGTARLWGGMGPPTTCMGGYLNVPHLGDWRERFSMYVVSVASFVHSVFLFLWCLFALFGGAVLSTCIWYPHLLRYSYTFTYTLLSYGIIHKTCSYIHMHIHTRTHRKIRPRLAAALFLLFACLQCLRKAYTCTYTLL